MLHWTNPCMFKSNLWRGCTMRLKRGRRTVCSYPPTFRMLHAFGWQKKNLSGHFQSTEVNLSSHWHAQFNALLILSLICVCVSSLPLASFNSVLATRWKRGLQLPRELSVHSSSCLFHSVSLVWMFYLISLFVSFLNFHAVCPVEHGLMWA